MASAVNGSNMISDVDDIDESQKNFCASTVRTTLSKEEEALKREAEDALKEALFRPSVHRKIVGSTPVRNTVKFDEATKKKSDETDAVKEAQFKAIAQRKISRPRPLTCVTYVEFNNRAYDLKAGLIDTFLNLERVDRNIYLARHLMKGRESFPAVYGGQVVGQALAAAAATVDPQFIPHSIHSFFIRTGAVIKPILYLIDRVRDGRSFCTRLVKAVQDGEAVFTAQLSFHKKESESVSHQEVMPLVPSPESLRGKLITDYVGQAVACIRNDNEEGRPSRRLSIGKISDIATAFDRVFDIRPCVPTNPEPEDESELRSMCWIRAKENIGEDHTLHQCVATYITDLTMVSTAIRPHLKKGFEPSMSFSLDHCVWLHTDEFRIDEWMLYETYSQKAKRSRGFIHGRLWTRDGELVLSTAQEALIRDAQGKPA